mgnify:FL=1
MSEKVRIGIIGAGGIAHVHINTFKELAEEVEIAAITDVNIALANDAAKTFQIPKVYDTTDLLLDDDQLDAVILCVPNRFHAPLAIKALHSGKHVLLEKPMGINGEAAKDIVRAQKETGKVLMVAHQMRWRWQSLEIRKQVENGDLGKIYHAKTGWIRRKGIPGWGSWFTQKEMSGGGPLIDLGVHMLDLSLYLMGDPKPVSVFGSTYSEFGPKKKGLGNWGRPNWEGFFDVEDFATALIKMDDGSTLSLDVSWALNMEGDDQPYVKLMGTEGGAFFKGDRLTFFTEKFDRPVDVNVPPPENSDRERVLLSKHFIDCIKEGKTPITSALSGLKTNLIIDAIFESSRLGREVLINWDI